MEEKIKQRLIGILVLIGSLFIILPFLFHNSRPSAAAEQKVASTVSNGATPPAVSVTLPAENATTPNANNAVAESTTPVSTPTVSSAAQQPPAPQTQKLQTAQISAPQTKPDAVATVPVDTSKLNSNTIASHPDASGFKADQAVSPKTGLTTGTPISTPSTTEAVSSTSPAADNQVPTTQPHHKHAVKTAHHSHHAAHAMHGKKWEIQLAVFSNAHNAKKLMAKLHAHHFAAHTRRVVHHGRHMTAVFVGPELNHQKTIALQHHLHREFHLNGVVKQV